MRDTIDMAREAGFTTSKDEWIFTELLKAFEALVRADERNKVWSQKHWTEYEQAIVQAEREACAKVCENIESDGYPSIEQQNCAATIRARGNT